jgi:hypothetical protein
MEKKKLGQLIESLHAELNAADSIDDESRSGLESLTRDIEKLARSDQSTAESRESAAAQLEDAALKFETDHPKLSMVLGELMDALGKLGI